MRNYLWALSAAATTMRCARVRRLGESLAIASALLISRVSARGGDARVTRREGEASTCSSVLIITSVTKRGILPYSVGCIRNSPIYTPASRDSFNEARRFTFRTLAPLVATTLDLRNFDLAQASSH